MKLFCAWSYCYHEVIVYMKFLYTCNYCVQCTPIFMCTHEYIVYSVHRLLCVHINILFTVYTDFYVQMSILCTVFTDYCVQIWCFMLERFLMFSSCNFSPDSFHGNLSRVFWFIMIPGFQAYSSPDNTPDTTRLIINYFNYFHQEMFTGGLVPEAYTGGDMGLTPPLGSVNSMVSRGFQVSTGAKPHPRRIPVKCVRP